LTVSILLLVVLVSDPRLFMGHVPHAIEVGGAVLRGIRLWLVCLTVCFTLNRLMEMVLNRRIRRAWIYILLWSVVIPGSYGMVAPQVERRWPAPAERDLVLFTAMIIVLAFAGAMFKRLADSVSRTAHFDHLTGLPNRVLLTKKLATAVERARTTTASWPSAWSTSTTSSASTIR
jgi:predicted signal transduction protein with EAL and GGDEF domain